VQDSLKQIGRGEPGEIQKASEWFGEIPCDDDAISQLPHVVRAGHPGLQKHGDGWCPRNEPASYVSEAVKSSNCGSYSDVKLTVRIDITLFLRRTESNGSRRPHGERAPPLARERKGEPLKADVSTGELCTVVCVPP
jgi:hypothetical protein